MLNFQLVPLRKILSTACLFRKSQRLTDKARLMTPNLSLIRPHVGSPTTAAGDEWEAARSVQERLFPAVRPAIPGLDYFGDWRPARGVSGDYLDYFEMSQGNLGLAVG